jgi:hypothetical protein
VTTGFTSRARHPRSHRRRQARLRQQKRERQAENAIDYTQALPTYHCDICHFHHERDNLWACVLIPFLNKETCPTCNAWSTPDPFHYNPILYLVTNPAAPYLNRFLIELREFHLYFDTLPQWKKSLYYLLLAILAFVLARKL